MLCRTRILDLLGDAKITFLRLRMLMPVEKVPYEATMIAFSSFSLTLLKFGLTRHEVDIPSRGTTLDVLVQGLPVLLHEVEEDERVAFRCCGEVGDEVISLLAPDEPFDLMLVVETTDAATDLLGIPQHDALNPQASEEVTVHQFLGGHHPVYGTEQTFDGEFVDL
jgi:hypothetical protein